MQDKNFDPRSYAAAATFPVKILSNEKLLFSALKSHKIPPIHLQLNPTNKCNFACSFCSCSSRDKSLELPLDKILQFMAVFKNLGGQSTTITGGGDPFLHRDIDTMIEKILDMDIKVGIVGNGSLWKRVNGSRKFEDITWIRTSSSDVLGQELKRIGKDLSWWFIEQKKIVKAFPQIDWAFSHVVTENPDFSLIADLINFANNYNFTHVRLVSDILEAEHLAESMARVKEEMQKRKIDDSIVNYQDRASYTRGMNPCYISLLKPVLAADGYIYPCCGVQYALAKPSRDYEPSMKMATMDAFDILIRKQKFFDGSRCVKCYYAHYNDALDTLLNGVEHQEFI